MIVSAKEEIRLVIELNAKEMATLYMYGQSRKEKK